MEFPKLLRNAFDAKVSPIDVHAGMVHDCTVTSSVSWCRALELFKNKTKTYKVISAATPVLEIQLFFFFSPQMTLQPQTLLTPSSITGKQNANCVTS